MGRVEVPRGTDALERESAIGKDVWRESPVRGRLKRFRGGSIDGSFREINAKSGIGFDSTVVYTMDGLCLD